MTQTKVKKNHDPYVRILEQIRSRTGIDFTSYKLATVHRRIMRRMRLHKTKDIEQYARKLKSDPREVEILSEDILINVTEFFRDPLLYTNLKKKVLPQLFKRHPNGSQIRVWIAGCSTGEEVYSFAIALLEYMESKRVKFPIQIFGTDISDKALARARQGIYSQKIVNTIPPDRLKRFFVKHDAKTWQVSKEIRDICVFARHNMLTDTPFSQLDIISCRNVLIYFDPTLQKKVIPIFHYALRQSGYLILGTSETTIGFQDLFEEVDKKTRIYIRKNVPGRFNIELARTTRIPVINPQIPKITAPYITNDDVEKEANRLLLLKYTPAWVIVNDDLTILQFRGEMYPFLEPAAGKASFNILKMVRSDLVSKVSEAISAARKSRRAVKRDHVRIKIQGTFKDVCIEVAPIRELTPRRHFLVLFSFAPEVIPHGKRVRYPVSSESGLKDRQILQLQQELVNTTEHLQSVIEKSEAANEELRSANEEIMSSNEEMQSINEELETAQEELQSSNEELLAVNNELEKSNAELEERNEELRCSKEKIQESEMRRRLVIESIRDYAVIMLDTDGHITSWNKGAQLIKGYTAGEILGKHFSIFYTPEAIAEHRPQKLLETAKRKGRVEDISWRVRKDGSRFWGDVVITAVRNEKGNLIGYVKVTRDLTEVKNLQDERDSSFKELELRVQERTQELAEMNARKDEFIATLSHELRNPLSPIVSSVEILKIHASTDPVVSKYVGIIEHHTNQITHLLKDLLDVSRVAHGKLELKLETVDLQDVVRHAIDATRTRVEEAQCKLRLSLPKEEVIVHGDPVRLEQIIINILDNAAKYSEPKGKISLSVQKKINGVYIKIKDTGIGISKTMIDKIFDVFTQAKASKKKTSGGLGLGLALARHLARLHGGDITVKSAGIGRGSEFEIYIPVHKNGE